MGAVSGIRVRLNVGCGDKFWPQFINVDKHAEPDVVCDGRKLTFANDYADEIHSIHFVEHVPRLEVDDMLVDWMRVLKPGGKLAIEVPCLNKMAQFIVDGEKNLALTLLGIFGDPRDKKPGMMHGWAYTKEELTDILLQAGYTDVEVKEPFFHVGKRDMRIEARKPS